MTTFMNLSPVRTKRAGRILFFLTVGLMTFGVAGAASADNRYDGRGPNNRDRGYEHNRPMNWNQHERSAYDRRRAHRHRPSPRVIYAPPPVVYAPPPPSSGITLVVPLDFR